MAITVGTVLKRVAFDLHEPNLDFKSRLWSPDEMILYVNYAETDFMRRTGILKYDSITILPGGSTILCTKPDGAMNIERVSFNRRKLLRQTTWDLERENPKWRLNPPGRPRYWHEDHLPVNNFELDRIPVAGGRLRVFYDRVPTVHAAAPQGFTENIAVPDVWEPFIRWEVIALALAKDGDNQDIARSSYSHRRYLLGVALARRLAVGATDLPPAGQLEGA